MQYLDSFVSVATNQLVINDENIMLESVQNINQNLENLFGQFSKIEASKQ